VKRGGFLRSGAPGVKCFLWGARTGPPNAIGARSDVRRARGGKRRGGAHRVGSRGASTKGPLPYARRAKATSAAGAARIAVTATIVAPVGSSQSHDSR
jgi:hypothetical protein